MNEDSSTTVHPIGVIHSPYATKEEAPIQGAFCAEGRGTVELFEKYTAGLQDIETFSHRILLYLFDRAGPVIELPARGDTVRIQLDYPEGIGGDSGKDPRARPDVLAALGDKRQ